MKKPSTWLALIAAIVYFGAYWISKQDIGAMYDACVNDKPARERHCLCKRDKAMDEIGMYRVVTSYSREMERVTKFAAAACDREKG